VSSNRGGSGERAFAVAGGRSAPASARFLSTLIFAGLLAVVPLSSIPYGSVEPWWSSLFEAAVLALAALWAFEGAMSGSWLRASHMLTTPALLLAGYAFLQSLTFGSSGAISFDPYETRLVALKILAYALYAAMLLRYCETQRRLRALLSAVVLTGLASALFGIARQATQRGQEGFLLEYLRPGAGFAQFINKNHFPFLAEMSLGLLLGLVAGRGVDRRKMLVPLALALPLWAAVVLSNSRGGLFAALCQLIFLGATFGAVWHARSGRAQRDGARDFSRLAASRPTRAALVAMLTLTVVVGTVWLGGDPLADRVASVREEVASESNDSTRTGRKEIWRATIKMIEDHPVAGVGFGGYWVAVSRYHEGSGGLVPQQAHNDWLELLASGGLAGLVLFAFFLYLFVARARVRLSTGAFFERASALGALAGLVGVAAHSLVEFGLHVPSNAYAAAALVAIAAVGVNGQKTSPSEY
jgi:O-antigen ligase